MGRNLFVIIVVILFLIVNLEVSEFVWILGAGHNPQPISEVILLQVLLSQVFEVPKTRLEKENNWVWTNEEINPQGRMRKTGKTTKPHLFEKLMSALMIILDLLFSMFTLCPKLLVFPLTLILSCKNFS